MPTVFVIGQDWALRAPVRAELLEQGVEALGFESVDHAARAAAGGSVPDLLVLDASSADADHPALAALARRSALLVVASGIGAPREMPPGAVVMRRPVRVAEIVVRVRQILEGQPA